MIVYYITLQLCLIVVSALSPPPFFFFFSSCVVAREWRERERERGGEKQEWDALFGLSF